MPIWLPVRTQVRVGLRPATVRLRDIKLRARKTEIQFVSVSWTLPLSRGGGHTTSAVVEGMKTLCSLIWHSVGNIDNGRFKLIHGQFDSSYTYLVKAFFPIMRLGSGATQTWFNSNYHWVGYFGICFVRMDSSYDVILQCSVSLRAQLISWIDWAYNTSQYLIILHFDYHHRML